MAGLTYLLDTNILTEGSRQRPDPAVMSSIAESWSQAGTGAPILHELHYGVMRMPIGRRRKRLAEYYRRLFASSLPILPYDADAARWHAAERARLTADGRTPAFADGQIAAIAVTNGLTLVTRNLADYDGFADLVVENWFQ